MYFFVGQILPFITLFVFLTGAVYKIIHWAKSPSIKMTLTPTPPTNTRRRLRLLGDYFLFRREFAANRSIWVLGWAFHLVLFFILIGHLRAFFGFFDHWAMGFGFSEEQIESVTHLGGTIAGIILFAIVISFLIRRFWIKRIREISTASDFLILLLLLVVIISGNGMRLFTALDPVDIRFYFKDLFAFIQATIPQNPWFLCHYFSVQILLMTIPFSKLFHFGGLYFSSELLYRE